MSNHFKYNKYQKSSKSTRLIAILILFVIVLFMFMSSQYFDGKNDVNSVSEPQITNVIVYQDQIVVSYYIQHNENVLVSLNANGKYNNILSSQNNFDGTYGSFSILCTLNESLPNLFSGINIEMSGKMIISHKEKIYISKEVIFDVNYIQKASLQFSSFYEIVNETHCRSETLCSVFASFLKYNGNVTIFYTTQYELIQSEMDIVNLYNDGIDPGLVNITTYEKSKIFAETTTFSEDFVNFDLTKSSFHKDDNNDVIDFCGEFIDYQVAININQEDNAAPDPIYYFQNITLNFNGINVDAKNSSTIIMYRG